MTQMVPVSREFHGTVTPPGMAGSVQFKGAVLQDTNQGFGFFTNHAGGRVFIGPAQ